MVYLGSKNKLAKHIVPIIQKYIDDTGAKTYIELFVGGANMIDKINCENRIGCDANPYLIKLLKYMRDDSEISIAPEDCSKEHYDDVRANNGEYSDEYYALIGYAASYGGRFFDGGYGRGDKKRNLYQERLRNMRKQAPNLAGIKFVCGDYLKFKYEKFENAVFYFDPPYREVSQYGKFKINYDEYYNFCRKCAEKNTVICSEFWMPEDFKCIWEKERKITLISDRTEGFTRTEKLYVLERN